MTSMVRCRPTLVRTWRTTGRRFQKEVCSGVARGGVRDGEADLGQGRVGHVST